MKKNSFVLALDDLKNGNSAKRIDWENKELLINKGSCSPIEKDFEEINGVSIDLFDVGDDDTLIRMPNLVLSEDGILSVYSPTSEDLLAEDWVTV